MFYLGSEIRKQLRRWGLRDIKQPTFTACWGTAAAAAAAAAVVALMFIMSRQNNKNQNFKRGGSCSCFHVFIQREKFVLNWMFSFVTAVSVLDLVFSWSEAARGVCVRTFETCDRQTRKMLFQSIRFIVVSFSSKNRTKKKATSRQAELKPAGDITAHSKSTTDAIKNIKTKCFNNKKSRYFFKNRRLDVPNNAGWTQSNVHIKWEKMLILAHNHFNVKLI